MDYLIMLGSAFLCAAFFFASGLLVGWFRWGRDRGYGWLQIEGADHLGKTVREGVEITGTDQPYVYMRTLDE
jgi:H+/Cl- antiporter ClcA